MGANHPGCPQDDSTRQSGADGELSRKLAGSVYSYRTNRIGLEIRTVKLPGKYVVGRHLNEGRAELACRFGEPSGTLCICQECRADIVFGSINRGPPRAVNYRAPRLRSHAFGDALRARQIEFRTIWTMQNDIFRPADIAQLDSDLTRPAGYEDLTTAHVTSSTQGDLYRSAAPGSAATNLPAPRTTRPSIGFRR